MTRIEEIEERATRCTGYAGADTMAVNPHTILKLTALVKAQQATLEDLNAALDKGKRDQYGRLKLTNAEGNMLWFKVSEALRLYKEFQE